MNTVEAILARLRAKLPPRPTPAQAPHVIHLLNFDRMLMDPNAYYYGLRERKRWCTDHCGDRWFDEKVLTAGSETVRFYFVDPNVALMFKLTFE